MPSMKLNNAAMRQFSVAKIFQENDERKTSVNFTADGRRLLVCDKSALSVYSCSRRAQIDQIHMQHYKPEVASFMQENHRILHSVTRLNSTIGCLDLNTRSHCRIFSGHSKSVRVLSVQPEHEDVFLSAGWDNQVIMWDFRNSAYVHIIKKLEKPLLAFDPAGLVFAATSGTELIEIHDVRMLSEEQEPCQKFAYNFNREQANWTQLQFSPDGKSLLIATDHSWCFSVDAFDGKFQKGFTGYENEQRLPLQATYTPDSQFVLSGADEGKVHIWRADTAEKVAVLKGNNAGPGRCMLFNPKATMFVSCGMLTLFWMPKANGEYKWLDRDNEEAELQENEGKEKRKQEPELKLNCVEQLQAQVKRQRMSFRKKIPLIDLTQLDRNACIDDDDDDNDDNDVVYVSQVKKNRLSVRQQPASYPPEDGELTDLE